MKDNKTTTKHSLKEIADAHIISRSVPKAERKEIIHEFDKQRRKLSANLTNEQRTFSAILLLKFKIEDYVKQSSFSQDFTFSFFLKEYISRLQLKNKDFAEQIGIKATELSQLLNNHRKPNDRILIRLEIHSNKNIDALLWYKIMEKDKEYELVNNRDLRQQERKHVKEYLSASF